MSLRLTDLAKRLLSRPVRTAKPLTARLGCETLEDRTVPTVVYTGTFDWGGLATVAVTVTDDTPGEYLWAYHVANTGFASVAKFPPGPGQGIGTFVVYSDSAGDADNLTDPAGWDGDAGIFMNDPTLIHWGHPEAAPVDILSGGSGDFSFTTPVVPVVIWAGEAYDSTYSSGVSGELAVPGAPPPEVSVAALADATEGGANGVFEFTRTGDTGSSLTVQFTLSGTATVGADYPGATTVTFAPGSATAIWEVSAIDDGQREGAESVVLTLDEASPLANLYEIGGPASATLNIFDADGFPLVSITATSDGVEAGPGGNPIDGEYTFTRSSADLSQPLDIDIDIDSASVATESADFSALPRTVRIEAGQTTATLAVPVLQDSLVEGDELLGVRILDRPDRYIPLSLAPATLIIADELLIKSVTWIPNPNATFGQAPMDQNPNPGGGLRIFAEKKSPTDKAARTAVNVVVQLNAKVKQTVHLRMYDVDDPSSNQPPVDNEQSATDNRGPEGLTPPERGSWKPASGIPRPRTSIRSKPIRTGWHNSAPCTFRPSPETTIASRRRSCPTGIIW